MYCMHVPGMGAVKIGQTRRSPRERARQLTNQTGFRHVVVWAQEFEDRYQAELRLHRALDRHRIRPAGQFNEYFRLGSVS